jgi:hypothetical protein
MNESKKLHGYYKVGRLRKPIADKIHRPAADIYVNDNHLRHIKNKHSQQGGLNNHSSVIAYVEQILSECNLICEGTGEALLMVSNQPSKVNVTVIELIQLDSRSNIYYVKTASRRPKSYLARKKILWIK